MEASNVSAFLPLLTVLEFLGLKISSFPIRVGETDVVTNVGLPQLAIDLVSEEEVSLGVARSLLVPITFSVTFACRRDVWYNGTMKISAHIQHGRSTSTTNPPCVTYYYGTEKCTTTEDWGDSTTHHNSTARPFYSATSEVEHQEHYNYDPSLRINSTTPNRTTHNPG